MGAYGEPWSAEEGDGYVRSLTAPPSGSRICQVVRNREAYARRIVACVNAAAGIPTPILEVLTPEGSWADRFTKAWIAKYDTLLEALPDIELLARVAEALAYRGIEPASDVEKLRVAAGRIRATIAEVERRQT
jgi:hypothetical protein